MYSYKTIYNKLQVVGTYKVTNKLLKKILARSSELIDFDAVSENAQHAYSTRVLYSEYAEG